jgi:hypothetical protein
VLATALRWWFAGIWPLPAGVCKAAQFFKFSPSALYSFFSHQHCQFGSQAARQPERRDRQKAQQEGAWVQASSCEAARRPSNQPSLLYTPVRQNLSLQEGTPVGGRLTCPGAWFYQTQPFPTGLLRTIHPGPTMELVGSARHSFGKGSVRWSQGCISATKVIRSHTEQHTRALLFCYVTVGG